MRGFLRLGGGSPSCDEKSVDKMTTSRRSWTRPRETSLSAVPIRNRSLAAVLLSFKEQERSSRSYVRIGSESYVYVSGG